MVKSVVDQKTGKSMVVDAATGKSIAMVGPGGTLIAASGRTASSKNPDSMGSMRSDTDFGMDQSTAFGSLGPASQANTS